jgi:hypothetical protein
MPISFTPELGSEILEKIHQKRWKVIYEYRNHGNPNDFQPIEEIFDQEADILEAGPRYHVYPAGIPFGIFIKGVVDETLQVPRVTIGGESRILYGFGIRDDHCYFVTNLTIDVRSADRGPKEYQFMLDALDTLEEFSLDNRPE